MTNFVKGVLLGLVREGEKENKWEGWQEREREREWERKRINLKKT